MCHHSTHGVIRSGRPSSAEQGLSPGAASHPSPCPRAEAEMVAGSSGVKKKSNNAFELCFFALTLLPFVVCCSAVRGQGCRPAPRTPGAGGEGCAWQPQAGSCTRAAHAGFRLQLTFTARCPAAACRSHSALTPIHPAQVLFFFLSGFSWLFSLDEDFLKTAGSLCNLSRVLSV